MSIQLMSQAWKTSLPTTKKIVLLALCDNANDQGECYPSISTIAEKCSLTERAVFLAIKFLEKEGILRRENRHGRSTIYHINPCISFTPEQCSPLNDIHHTPERRSPPPLNVVHPTPEQRSPITINEPSIETSINHQVKKSVSKNQIQKPDGVDQSVWDDFLILRKSKKAPLTSTALRMLLSEVAKSGKTANDALMVCCQRGWQTYKSEWDVAAAAGVAGKAKDLPLGSDQQIEHAYRVECGGDPSKARFGSYFEMRKFIVDFREKKRAAA